MEPAWQSAFCSDNPRQAGSEVSTLQATCADIVLPEGLPFYCKAPEGVSEKLGPAGLLEPYCKRLAAIPLPWCAARPPGLAG
jgi:hypothetical protein